MMEFVFLSQKRVKEYAKRFSQGHWTLLGLGDEKNYSQSDRWWNDWKRQVIQYLRVSVLWVVGFWRRGWQRHLALRCGCFEHRKGTRKTRKNPWITRSKTFGISPGLWNQCEGNIEDFESLTETIQFTRVCELASIRHRVSAGMNYKTRPDEDDVVGQIIPLCREYTLSLVKPAIQSLLQQFLEDQLLDQSFEVQIVKIIDQYGLDIAIPSPNDKERTSYVMISRRKSRFVVHIPNAELRSSAELLTCWTSKIGRRRILLRTVEYWQPGDWCGQCFKSY